VSFVKLDYDMNKDDANRHGINAFPSIIAVNAKGDKIADFTDDIYSTSKLIQFATKAIA
jgi:thiol-disulfide isomerase/thioredoxin